MRTRLSLSVSLLGTPSDKLLEHFDLFRVALFQLILGALCNFHPFFQGALLLLSCLKQRLQCRRHSCPYLNNTLLPRRNLCNLVLTTLRPEEGMGANQNVVLILYNSLGSQKNIPSIKDDELKHNISKREIVDNQKIKYKYTSINQTFINSIKSKNAPIKEYLL